MLRRRATVRLTFALVAPGVAPIAVTGSGDNSARETCAGASGQTAVRVPGVSCTAASAAKRDATTQRDAFNRK